MSSEKLKYIKHVGLDKFYLYSTPGSSRESKVPLQQNANSILKNMKVIIKATLIIHTSNNKLISLTSIIGYNILNITAIISNKTI